MPDTTPMTPKNILHRNATDAQKATWQQQQAPSATGQVGFTVVEQVRQKDLIACSSATELDVIAALAQGKSITHTQANDLLNTIATLRAWGQNQLELAVMGQRVQDHLHVALSDCGAQLRAERAEKARVVMQLSKESTEWRNRCDEAQSNYDELKDRIAGYGGIGL